MISLSIATKTSVDYWMNKPYKSIQYWADATNKVLKKNGGEGSG
jgi:hypothetical protein